MTWSRRSAAGSCVNLRGVLVEQSVNGVDPFGSARKPRRIMCRPCGAQRIEKVRVGRDTFDLTPQLPGLKQRPTRLVDTAVGQAEVKGGPGRCLVFDVKYLVEQIGFGVFEQRQQIKALTAAGNMLCRDMHHVRQAVETASGEGRDEPFGPCFDKGHYASGCVDFFFHTQPW